ncbi:MAG TPA: protein translocase subunit SecD [Caulobacteraceae bacterium]|jgi:preprotein translocase subunit SecD|nr:protein translocase subunit SecD [Caulobacteraceae bacterium]
MIQLRRWKVVLVVLATLFGIVFTLPNLLPASVTQSWPAILSQKLNLGLDLQGGSYLLLEVDTAALQKETLNNLVEDVRRDLQTAQIPFTGLAVANGAVGVRITDPSQAPAAYNTLAKLAQPLPGAATGRDLTVTRSDQIITLTPVPEAQKAAAAKAVDQSIEIVRRRIDQLGTREPTIVRQGADRIVVQAPGESDPERLKRVIGQTAKLTFQMLDETVPPDQVAAGRIPPQDELLDQPNTPSEPKVLVQRRVLVSGDQLVTAGASFDQYNRPVVSFRFNGVGARRFGDATTQNVKRRFAIVLDGKVLSAPVINEPITGGSGQISGNFTTESANDLALLLRAGALPAPLKVEEQRTVGAELGADSVRAGAFSLGIGAVAIFIFIILAYGLFGVFAAIALVVNVLMLVATLTATQATLTLPGIAGLILTLAVAVDANVLIYERMRDEAREGRPPLMALDNGYRRAMVSIFDANVTTLISAVIMFSLGAGPVKGFAWTLGVGVLTSLFTALLITQVLIGWWFKATRPKQLPI